MKSIYLLPVIVCLIVIAGCSSSALSPAETQLLAAIGFDPKPIQTVKGVLKVKFNQYETSDPGYMIRDGKKIKSGVKKEEGISFKVNVRSMYNAWESVTRRLEGSGYMAFLTDADYSVNKTELVIIKSDDQFDILSYEKPDGINYDVTAEDLAARLHRWDKELGIRIVGADYDWVEFIFDRPPADREAFAREVYEFCPDSVDQGVGSLEALAEEIGKGRLFLWWD